MCHNHIECIPGNYSTLNVNTHRTHSSKTLTLKEFKQASREKSKETDSYIPTCWIPMPIVSDPQLAMHNISYISTWYAYFHEYMYMFYRPRNHNMHVHVPYASMHAWHMHLLSPSTPLSLSLPARLNALREKNALHCPPIWVPPTILNDP